MKKLFLPFIIFFIITLGTFLVYISDLTSYGATWDELVFHQGTGKTYYEFLQTKDLTFVLENDENAWFPPVAPTIGNIFVVNTYLEKYLPWPSDRFHLAAVLFG